MRVELVSDPYFESLTDLLGELHSHYNPDSSVPRESVRAYLTHDLLGPHSPLLFAIAINDDGVVTGLAAITLTYSLVELRPDKGRQCWLKELYVRSSHRGVGVGRALMAWVAFYAVDNMCCRIDWPVQTGNGHGIRFYENLGATHVADRLSFRLSEPNLSRLANLVKR